MPGEGVETNNKCEVCGDKIKEGEVLYGCEQCARLYGPCCSAEDSLCIDCV